MPVLSPPARSTTAIAGAIAAVVLGLPSLAAADDLPSQAPLPSCLDRTIKDELGRELTPRGVQKRDFLKDGQVALVARGGLFGGDLTSASWVGGGALDFYFTEDFGLQASFELTPIALDLDEPLAEFFGDDRFEPGMGYLTMLSAVWSPIHAKMKIGSGIVHSDIMLLAGAGRMFHDSVQGVTFQAGMALDMFTTQWITFRFEARDVMAVQEAVAETRFTNNLVATAAIVLWIPTPL
jgi:outer membrane beta-barrel protein